jgi:cold shock CspA family protein
MRTHGTLVKWNDERGFGFIQPTVGTEELFVHISAFPRDGIRPRIDEMVSFEVELREDGKERAVRLMRPGGRAASRHRPDRLRPAPARERPTSGWIGWIGLPLLAVIGYVSYARLTTHN